MPIYIKYRGGRGYYYEQKSRRVRGRKNPVTDTRYLGPVDKIEPGETAAWNGIVSDFEKGPRPEAPKFDQNEFLEVTQNANDTAEQTFDENTDSGSAKDEGN